MSAIPQRDALKLQLAAIAGNEPPSSLLEIRYFRGRGARQLFVPVRELDRAATAILNHAEAGNVFVGAAPRVKAQGGIDAVAQSWVLWTDPDDPTSIGRHAAFAPLPSIVIRTGTPDHGLAIWPLSEPLAAENVRRANRRLALALGADRAACDAARIIRPAGTRNWKHDPPAAVTCTRLSLERFVLRDIVGDLPDDPAEVPGPVVRKIEVPRDRLPQIDGLLRTVREAQPGTRNNRLFWAASRLADDQIDTGENLDALLQAALAAGLPEHEAQRTIDSARSARAAA